MNIWSSISGEPRGVSEYSLILIESCAIRFGRVGVGGCRLVSLQVFYSSLLLQSSSRTLQKTLHAFRIHCLSWTDRAQITMLMHDYFWASVFTFVQSAAHGCEVTNSSPIYQFLDTLRITNVFIFRFAFISFLSLLFLSCEHETYLTPDLRSWTLSM
jgi:hypothetical protein